jgi:hypothetical protein
VKKLGGLLLVPFLALALIAPALSHTSPGIRRRALGGSYNDTHVYANVGIQNRFDRGAYVECKVIVHTRSHENIGSIWRVKFAPGNRTVIRTFKVPREFRGRPHHHHVPHCHRQ